MREIHVSPPCLIQPPPLKAMMLVGEVMVGSGVWQDCQSFPTRTLHQRIEPHDGQKNDYYAFSPLFLFIHAHRQSGSSSRRDHCLFIILTHRIFPGFDSHSELGAVLFHPRFSCEGPFTFSAVWSPYRLVWPCNFSSFRCWYWDHFSSRELWLLPFSSRFVVLLWSPLRCDCCGLLYIWGLVQVSLTHRVFGVIFPC